MIIIGYCWNCLKYITPEELKQHRAKLKDHEINLYQRR